VFRLCDTFTITAGITVLAIFYIIFKLSMSHYDDLSPASWAPLLLLFTLWLLARLFNILGQYSIAGASDLAFMLLFDLFIFVPIIKAKQWRQFAIMTVIVMLITANGLYYAGQRAFVDKGNYFGNYSGFYVVVAAFFVLI